MYDYQKYVANLLVKTRYAAIWVDMGRGKTIITLTALAHLFDQFDIGRVLIVAPLRVVQHVWQQEIAKWNHTRHLTSTLLWTPGEPGRHLEARMMPLLKDKAQIHLINIDNITRLIDVLGDSWPYDCVILDEADLFKAYDSQRYERLRERRVYMYRLVELTGTPASSGYMDLWSQVALLDRGKRLGRVITHYRERWWTRSYDGYSWKPRPGAEEEIREVLKDICFSIPDDQYAKLPEKTENPIEIVFDKKLREQYRELEREFLLELDNTVEAVNAGVLCGKLLQFCNGAIYSQEEGEDRLVNPVHNLKLDALSEIIEESNGQPILLAYQFKHDVARIRKRFKDAVVMDNTPGVIKQWEKGKIPLLIIHPRSEGRGLGFQHGGHILVLYGLMWSLREYTQTIKRIWRDGQEHPVMIHRIVAENSIEDVIYARLQGHEFTEQELLKSVRISIEENM
tara:strand:- start:368 stop:1729 length:1362 start_codon:yes stop_codon:yes gene_type:complete